MDLLPRLQLSPNNIKTDSVLERGMGSMEGG